MIPLYLHLKSKHREYSENNQSNHFLYYFKLHNIKRTTVITEADTICRYLKTIFKKSQSPGKSNYPSISGEWNAPPTFSFSARFAPASVSLAQAASTASLLPEITSWPGQL